MAALLNPREESQDSDMISILWSRDGNLDNTPNVAFQPNHSVFLNVIDSEWIIAGKQKMHLNGNHFNEPPYFTPKEGFQPKISDLFKSRPLKPFQLTLKQILLHLAWQTKRKRKLQSLVSLHSRYPKIFQSHIPLPLVFNH